MKHDPSDRPAPPAAGPGYLRRYFDPVTRPSSTDAPYLYTDEIILAVNVAMATRRPLLVEGPPGCGKSGLAKDAALHLGWRYLEKVVTSRTRAQDLLWHFDTVQRLGDAQVVRSETAKLDAVDYIRRGILWEAFAPVQEAPQGPAVVLIDEIDKAEPDMPNDMLVPLAEFHFSVGETGQEVEAREMPLIIITSNGERDLPEAFLRRCIVLTLTVPDGARRLDIARAHFPEHATRPAHAAVMAKVSDWFGNLLAEAEAKRLRPPGTAEFLDALRACFELDLKPESPLMTTLSGMTLLKHARSGGAL